MKLKNKELNALLFNLLYEYKDEGTTKFGGLLTEQMGLGLKRRLEKIRAEVYKHFVEFQKDVAEIRTAMENKAAEQLPEGAKLEEYKAAKEGDKYELWNKAMEGLKDEMEKELKELGDEEVEIDKEPASLTIIEKIETAKIYDWELLEKIAV